MDVIPFFVSQYGYDIFDAVLTFAYDGFHGTYAISKQAEADIVIIAACGERANEVVEIFTEFPELVDPHTGRKLMERTIIIAILRTCR